mmetsp:Transcript_68692/g.199279  ORF Transcript_68692/g.199279 Transcript_68692/m.199279 type:complete len:225 (-) Transcript_68692:247-921(-)
MREAPRALVRTTTDLVLPRPDLAVVQCRALPRTQDACFICLSRRRFRNSRHCRQAHSATRRRRRGTSIAQCRKPSRRSARGSRTWTARGSSSCASGAAFSTSGSPRTTPGLPTARPSRLTRPAWTSRALRARLHTSLRAAGLNRAWCAGWSLGTSRASLRTITSVGTDMLTRGRRAPRRRLLRRRRGARHRRLPTTATCAPETSARNPERGASSDPGACRASAA